MVKFRELSVEIISARTLQPHPEFSHPESSQYKSNGPILNGSSTARSATSLSNSRSKADAILGRTPSIAVYIPSIPATRFWIRWSVGQPLETDDLYFFKLYLDGRHVLSWGTDPRTRPNGQTMRALYQPDQAHDVVIDGVRTTLSGTEGRAFYFGSQLAKSSASDGGTIEIRVHRALKRKRIPSKAEKFRGQGSYGICLPSSGIITNPEDLRYFDWSLMDPIDDPYATFSFHYRSWQYLQDLQLIPPEYSSTRGDQHCPEDILENSDTTKDAAAQLKSHMELNLPLRSQSQPAPETLGLEAPGLEIVTIKGRPNKFIQLGRRPATPPVEQKTKKRAIRRCTRSTCELPSPQKYSQSPSENVTPVSGRSSALSRRSSASSHAPSIAPSLLQYLDRASSASPEPILSYAISVPISPLREAPKSTSSSTLRSPLTHGSHSPLLSQPSLLSVNSKPRLISPNLVSSKPRVRRFSKRLPSPPNPQRFLAKWRKSTSCSPDREQDVSSLSESEWLSQSASPCRENRKSTPTFGSTGTFKKFLGQTSGSNDRAYYGEARERTGWI